MLLSSVRVIVAAGGKREKGAVNEKKARNDDFWGGDDVATGLERWAELIDRQTRKMDAAKKRTRMAIRGGRIVGLSRVR